MIYYFSGVVDTDLAIKLNIDLLYSAKNDRSAISKIIKYKQEHPEYNAHILIDSGAWSIFVSRMKKGEEMTDEAYKEYTDEYLEFLNKYGDYFTNFVSVDAIVNPNNVEADYGQKTWDNYLYMYDVTYLVDCRKKYDDLIYQGNYDIDYPQDEFPPVCITYRKSIVFIDDLVEDAINKYEDFNLKKSKIYKEDREKVEQRAKLYSKIHQEVLNDTYKP